ncbi:MAG: peptidase S41 [Bacteroidetes bacterium GWF2_33_38]|nr:MAG: peptidase S41 [Bacteroidetes bacterium GWF2_33_38]OFY76495.1 MAG: peptidase S41 [Bacteroidetes bacterium RIFOXYA12_FULL_33_9]HBX52631.1 peptidase S41 [Bacteroidales bacterium]
MEILKKFKLILISLFIGIVALSFTKSDDVNFEISKNLDIYFTLFKELNLYYVDEKAPGDLIKSSIDKMLQTLDPYTVYIPESQMEDYKLMTTGQYGGIGALIRKSGEYIVIAEPYETFPAYKAGLKAGDIIIEVDGNTIKGKSTEDISEALKGQPNTSLKLLLKRPGLEKEFEKEIIREEIKINSVQYSGVISDGIGYIRFSSFTENSSEEIKKAFISLKEKHKINSIVLDLRGNPGGLLIESVNLANIFVKKGEEVVSTKGKISEWNNTYKTMFEATDEEIPVVVLVNRGSASASEIVAGAFQDLDRAVIIGERTFGKGLVQTTRPLSYNSKLKVTTAKYYIPSGRCIQALDYTHRNEDGSVGKVPDSLITEFATKNGRKVYDGGGVLPDIEVKPMYLSRIAVELVAENYIFDFATIYANKHEKIDAAATFSINDADYQDFITYLNDKRFDYSTLSEKKLKELIDITEKEKYYETAKTEIESLQKKIAHDSKKDLETFKEEIVELINEEIISRYYYQKGRIEFALTKDPEVEKAIEILQNQELYKNTLIGKK